MKSLVAVFIYTLIVSFDDVKGSEGETRSIDGYENIVINAILTERYNTSVSMTIQLRRRRHQRFIVDVVNRLIRESRRELLEYTYNLWQNEEAQEIVKQYFPVEVTQIFSGNNVKIINTRDNLALKLGVEIDNLNDRIAYGDANDKTSENVSWKLIPLWEYNRVYFKIYNVRRNQYLKLGTEADYAGDHSVYGADNADKHRHQWLLKPVKLENKVVYFIYNREYNQGLKLGKEVDNAGDRRVYSNAGSVEGQPEYFSWSISAFD